MLSESLILKIPGAPYIGVSGARTEIQPVFNGRHHSRSSFETRGVWTVSASICGCTTEYSLWQGIW